MRPGPLSDVLASAFSYEVRAQSYLGGSLLSDDVPIAGGQLTWQGTQTIESGALAVSAWDRGHSWVPSTPRDPLARYGQELSFTAVIGAGERSWEIPLGRQVITDWSQDSGDVEVTVAGILNRTAEHRLPRPMVPLRGGTLVSELRRLMPGGIPVDISDDLVDRACPSSFEWNEDRLAAIYNLIDAWPALMLPDGFGGVRIVPDISGDDFTPALTYRDGEGGTVVSAPRSDTREQTYNYVVARAQSDDLDAKLVQAEAAVLDGELSINGAYGTVLRYFSSPALRTAAQCLAAARSVLEKSQRPARALTVTAPLDPRVELYDPVEVTYDGETSRGHVIGIVLPLVPGDMQLTVGMLP